MACKLLFLASLAAILGVGLHSVELSVAPPKGCTGTLTSLSADNDSAEIVVPAFFPFPANGSESHGRELDNGHYLIPAAVLALDEINSRPGLLPGYHLRLDIRDSSCDKYKGVYELILSAQKAQNGTAPRVAVLGGGCSLVSAGLGLLTPRYELPQVSYGNNPSSADRNNVLPFFQTVGTFDQRLRTALEVLHHFRWIHNVALIAQENEIYTRVLETVVTSTLDGNFTASVENTSISINIVVLHEIHGDVNLAASFATFFKDVRDKNLRVIVAAVNENYARLLLCEAKSGRMPGSGFVWVFIGSFSDSWWERSTTCVIDAEDVESVLIISSEIRNLNESQIMEQTSGKTITAFQAEYEARLQQWCPGGKAEPLATTTYDALWAIALAVNSTMGPTGSIAYNSSDLYSRITTSLSETNFLGASGQVHFNEARGRVGINAIHQTQSGVHQFVGTYDNGQLSFQSGRYPLMWPEGAPPSDVPEEIQESVPLWFIGPAVGVTLLGIGFSIIMFVFNWVYRKHRILLAASQRLNYIILAGTWLGFFSVLILSVLESEIGTKMSDELFASLCIIRLTALSMSFTLAYGTMFTRAWRIYRIFNDPWVAKRPLRDHHLMLMVALLLVGDLIILIIWTAIDHYRRFTSVSEIDYGSYSRCTYLSCGSSHLFIWLSIVGMYKILLMLGGVFVVSLVRKGVVERKIFDDSRSLSLALYVTAISFSLGLPLQFLFLLQFQVVFAFIAGAAWVNISAYSTIVCVFLPKFYAIVIKKDSGKNLRSLKSVFYVAHPEMSQSPDCSNGRLSPEYNTMATDFNGPITDGINFGSIRALPDSVAKSVSFEDTVDFIT